MEDHQVMEEVEVASYLLPQAEVEEVGVQAYLEAEGVEVEGA